MGYRYRGYHCNRHRLILKKIHPRVNACGCDFLFQQFSTRPARLRRSYVASTLMALNAISLRHGSRYDSPFLVCCHEYSAWTSVLRLQSLFLSYLPKTDFTSRFSSSSRLSYVPENVPSDLYPFLIPGSTGPYFDASKVSLKLICPKVVFMEKIPVRAGSGHRKIPQRPVLRTAIVPHQKPFSDISYQEANIFFTKGV